MNKPLQASEMLAAAVTDLHVLKADFDTPAWDLVHTHTHMDVCDTHAKTHTHTRTHIHTYTRSHIQEPGTHMDVSWMCAGSALCARAGDCSRLVSHMSC